MTREKVVHSYLKTIQQCELKYNKFLSTLFYDLMESYFSVQIDFKVYFYIAKWLLNFFALNNNRQDLVQTALNYLGFCLLSNTKEERYQIYDILFSLLKEPFCFKGQEEYSKYTILFNINRWLSKSTEEDDKIFCIFFRLLEINMEKWSLIHFL